MLGLLGFLAFVLIVLLVVREPPAIQTWLRVVLLTVALVVIVNVVLAIATS